MKLNLVVLLLATGLCGWGAVILGQTPPDSAGTPISAKKPGVFIGPPGHMPVEVSQKLVRAGFNLDQAPSLTARSLTWEQVQKYNVLVLWQLGETAADLSLNETTKQNLAVLKRFVEAGGGLLIFPEAGQSISDLAPQDAFLKPLGLTLLFDELPVDPETSVVGTAWQLPFAYTDAIVPSPVTDRVKGLWYPALDTRPGGENHSFSFIADQNWTEVVMGSKTSMTHKISIQGAPATEAGTYSKNVPLVAIRQSGKGRLMVYGITAEYLDGAYAMTTLEGIVLERGLQNRPSGGYQLLENGLKWLSEPSLREAVLGGANSDPTLLDDPNKTKFVKPYTWPANPVFPVAEERYEGAIGARTTYSSGHATPDQWVAAAKAASLSYVVFLEEFSQLSPENFAKLKADCDRLSSDDFSAIPGFTIDDEIGDHYFYFGSTFSYPPKDFLSEDGKVFRSRDTGFDPKNPYQKGQLSMTTLDYAYTLSRFKLTAGHYFFKDDPIPFVNFFSNWDAIGFVTQRDGAVLEDAEPAFLTLAAYGQGPMPLAIDLMTDPAELAKSKWHTVLRFPSSPKPAPGMVPKQGTKIRDYFSQWHLFPDDPARLFVTSGPEIENWSFTGPRDYQGGLRGDFVWQDYRWILHGKVSSAVGLAEVAVYDGTHLFRRFLPGGKKDFEFQLDLTHDRQHELVLIATDLHGDRAVSGDQIDRNQRLEEFQCSDRNNQLLYSYNTNSKGIGVKLGGNSGPATPWKRIAQDVTPSGIFTSDPLLGAPAFDGGASGAPDFYEDVQVQGVNPPILQPNVSESRRLLNSMDVEMGDGKREYAFADNIKVGNVWHTLWRTVPVPQFSVTRRNCYVQTNPDSPLGVYLMDVDIRLKQGLPNQGFHIAAMTPSLTRLWTVRDDSTCVTGNWEDTLQSERRRLDRTLDAGNYVGFLDGPLGGAVVFALSKGLNASLSLPQRSTLALSLPAENSPQKMGDTAHIRLLLLGLPRQTASTAFLPSSSTEVVERFYRDFALDGGKPNYKIDPQTGTVLDQRYLLEIDGAKDQAFSGVIDGKLISSLPITVAHLHDNWSAYLYDRTLKQARPIGMFEGKAWLTVCPNGKVDFFAGHPIVADNPAVFIQVTQSGENGWSLEVHNPTDQPIVTTLRKNPFFDPLKDKSLDSQPVTLPPGSSIYREL